MTDYKDILEKYGDDVDAIRKAMYDYMKENQIPYVKVLEGEPPMYEVYDGSHSRIVDQKMYNKIKNYDPDKNNS